MVGGWIVSPWLLMVVACITGACLKVFGSTSGFLKAFQGLLAAFGGLIVLQGLALALPVSGLFIALPFFLAIPYASKVLSKDEDSDPADW